MMAILPFCAEAEDHDGALLAWCERTWPYSRGASWQAGVVIRATPVHLYIDSLRVEYDGPRLPISRNIARFEFLDQRHFNQWRWECATQGKLIEITEREMHPVSARADTGWPYISTRPCVVKGLESWLLENCGREWHEWALLPGSRVGFVDAGHHALFTLTWC